MIKDRLFIINEKGRIIVNEHSIQTESRATRIAGRISYVY